MKREICNQRPTVLALALGAALAPAGASAVTYDLCATTGTVMMPDATVVPIWGYAAGPGCVPGDATLPGPVLEVPPGDTTLTVNLNNQLSVPTSIFIPGLPKAAGDPLVPVGGQAPGSRVTSFDKTVAPGGMASYTWTVTPGTYLYESGTDVRTQVPMGMYGAVVNNATATEAYPGVAIDDDKILIFSEIDPDLNADPTGFGGARVTTWSPRYFLINGQTYDPAIPSTIGVDVGASVLLRMVNAGLETFVPSLHGAYLDLIAEDSYPYPHPLRQYGVELPAGKTIDAMFIPGAEGTYALYDRALHTWNGGLVTQLVAAAAAGAPAAAGDSYSIDEDASLTADGVLPNPEGVLANDTGNGSMTAFVVDGVSAGTLLFNPDGTFGYSPNPDFSGSDGFSYQVNDGGPDSNIAAVTITVNPVNDPPVAVGDSYGAVEGQLLSVAAPGVLANDADVDGDVLTASAIAPPGALTLNGDGSFSYMPAGTAGAVETFDYQACDPSLTCSAAVTVTVTVAGPAPNVPPVANDDNGTTQRNTPLVGFDLVANDSDSDGTIDPTSVVITSGGTTPRGGSVANNGNGTVNYSPKPGFRGTDTFTYTVADNAGAVSNEATVRINVVK